MEQLDRIPAEEAMTLVGVSLKTLLRFAEAGYLQVERSETGLHQFSKQELHSVFGIPVAPSTQPPSSPEQAPDPAQITPTFIEQAPQLDAPINAIDGNSSHTLEAPLPGPEATTSSKYEIISLKNTIALQEKLLDLREKEVNDLKQEREWLRTRIEKLEEKADRDQLLLLSQTQVAKKLIAFNTEKRSPLQRALQWFGVQAPTPHTETIEIETKDKK